VVAGIDLFQQRWTEHALEALRGLSSPRAMVIRDGRQFSLLHPLDILICRAGGRQSPLVRRLEAGQEQGRCLASKVNMDSEPSIHES
jgi:hypothetical protein